MQIHSLKRKTPNKKSVQIGRGGKRGKTSSRGTKGQGARAGRKIRPEIRDAIKRLPKLRGRGKNSFLSIQVKPMVVNLSSLSIFKAGEKITPETIIAKGILKTYKGRNPRVKILANGTHAELAGKLVVSGCMVSAAVKEIMEKAGATVK